MPKVTLIEFGGIEVDKRCTEPLRIVMQYLKSVDSEKANSYQFQQKEIYI